MKAFEMAKLCQQQADSGNLYLEFLNETSMSLGIYTLEAGAKDPQQPHKEDEVYYVISGRGQIFVSGENRAVQPGSIVFVAAHAEHYFHHIEETLTLLVFFAPAETSS